ncbi:hypothetical protein FSP39_013674 [Pinctada imbricata]|uniref:PHD-type domain-containing protein n=1 Tax=Pinctada imbricata TaxID=66713 RepID=A0AA89C1C8_PINIB|nr:hypothetical protein FSP39_013674 [Pinctada imbricata]
MAFSLRNQGLSYRKISDETGIPLATLHDHLKGKYKGYDTSFGREKTLTDEEEDSLINYLHYMAGRGFPLSRQNLKVLVFEILKRRPRPTAVNIDKGPSDRFITNFLKRHKNLLSLRQSHSLESCRAEVHQGQIDHFYGLLKSMMESLELQHSPDSIYNMDESGFSGRLVSSKRVIMPKASRHAYQSQVSLSGHTTVVQAISASGRALPPMLIFSGCMPRGDPQAGIPNNWMMRCTESGFINTEIFIEWFTELFLPSVGHKRPVLLLLDNLSSHWNPNFIDLAKENNIDLLFFPSHASHLLQPLDVVYFHLLKQKVADLAVSLGYLGCKTLPRLTFPKLLHQAMNQITGSSISSSFLDTGIYPFNNKAVKALQPAPKAKNSEVSLPSDDVCTECGHSKENSLVKLGLVSKELANILVEPPVPQKKERSKKRTHEFAEAVPSKSQEKKQTKKQKKTETAHETEVHEEAEIADQSMDALCEVCMSSGLSWYFWVGCDTCTRWFHYECLPSSVQTDVDISLVVPEKMFICNVCKAEE